MWIKEIDINYSTTLMNKGENSVNYVFSQGFNLISSQGKNSCGKTSLIRFIIWGLGFDVGLTNKFNRIYSSVHLVVCDNPYIHQIDRTYHHIKLNNSRTFQLPDETITNMIVKLLIDNKGCKYLYPQVLGLFYFDQDQGLKTWNLGRVAQSFGRDHDYRLNFKTILFALENKDYYSLHLRHEKLNRQSTHVGRLINDISTFSSRSHLGIHKNMSITNRNQELMDSISEFNLKRKQVINYLNTYKRSIKDKHDFYKLLGKLNVRVKDRRYYDHEVPVNSQTIVKNDIENTELRYIIKYYEMKLKKINGELRALTNKKKALFHLKDKTDDNKDYLRVSREISLSGINLNDLYGSKKNIDNRRNMIKNNINQDLKSNKLYASTWNWAIKFSNNLNLSLFFNIKRNRLLTRVIKYSGAQRSLVILTLRLAMYKTVMDYLGVNWPIIIDSPGSQEMDARNLNKLVDNIKQHFPHTQLFIATNDKIMNKPNNKITLEKGVFGDL